MQDTVLLEPCASVTDMALLPPLLAGCAIPVIRLCPAMQAALQQVAGGHWRDGRNNSAGYRLWHRRQLLSAGPEVCEFEMRVDPNAHPYSVSSSCSASYQ